MFSSKDPIEKNIKLADDLGLKENEKARFINLMVQKDFEKELVQKDFEKELVQKDFEMKTSCLVALHRRQLSAISKRFVGIISEKVL